MNKHISFHKRLTAINGIGDALANKLIAQGITTMRALKENIDILPKSTQIYLKYKICRRIPRALIERLIKYLPSNLIVVGSYRRGAEFVADVDFLTMGDLKNEQKAIMGSKKYNVCAVFNCGEHRRAFIINFDNINIHVDLFKTTKEDMPFALFHYTGSRTFNIRTRAHAKKLGYKLNQYGLFKGKKKIKLGSEREIFKYLGITYKPPHKRNE